MHLDRIELTVEPESVAKFYMRILLKREAVKKS